MKVEDIRDPYVQFVLIMTHDCAQDHPEGEEVFAPFFIEWLTAAVKRVATTN